MIAGTTKVDAGRSEVISTEAMNRMKKLGYLAKTHGQ